MFAHFWCDCFYLLSPSRGWKRKLRGKNTSQDRETFCANLPSLWSIYWNITLQIQKICEAWSAFWRSRARLHHLFADGFFLFSFGSCKVHCLTHAIFCNLHLCSLEIKRKASLAQQKSASPPQNLLSQNEGGRGLGWGGEGRKAAQCTATIPPLSWAAMMSAFWLQTAYLCFNSCQEQQISG